MGGGGCYAFLVPPSSFPHLTLSFPLSRVLSPDSLGLSHAHIDSPSEGPPASLSPSHLCPPYLRFAFSAHL